MTKAQRSLQEVTVIEDPERVGTVAIGRTNEARILGRGGPLDLFGHPLALDAGATAARGQVIWVLDEGHAESEGWQGLVANVVPERTPMEVGAEDDWVLVSSGMRAYGSGAGYAQGLYQGPQVGIPEHILAMARTIASKEREMTRCAEVVAAREEAVARREEAIAKREERVAAREAEVDWQGQVTEAWKDDVLEDLDRLGRTTAEGNWDGAGAEPVTSDTVDRARGFAKRISTSARRPDVSATPHGEIVFFWEGPGGEEFDVLVLPSGEFAVAGTFGRIQMYGSAGGDLPACVMTGISWAHGRRWR